MDSPLKSMFNASAMRCQYGDSEDWESALASNASLGFKSMQAAYNKADSCGTLFLLLCSIMRDLTSRLVCFQSLTLYRKVCSMNCSKKSYPVLQESSRPR